MHASVGFAWLGLEVIQTTIRDPVSCWQVNCLTAYILSFADNDMMKIDKAVML